jgi:FKBP-type peptidyl-prolyl cis-trans isomerase FkpA
MISRRRIAIMLAVLFSTFGLAACGSDTGSNPSMDPAAGGVTELQIQELRIGNGAEATTGKTLTARYTGWLYDQRRAENKGTQFDAGTFTFVLGSGQAIRGFDQGFVGMKVNGQRRLTIPPQLGYGAAGNGPIPPNASLVFDVELTDAR